MPRGARLDTPGTLHHVIVRGIEKGSIVRDDQDRKEYLRRTGELAQGMGTNIYAFALMTNHAHILLKSGEQGLSTFMRRLLSGYAQYFNRRHKRVGHLFQNRYKSIICEEEAYFDKLVAYIHLNPLRGGLVHTVEELAFYPWCGHAVMMHKVLYSWFNRDYVLSFFGETESKAQQAYSEYLGEEIGKNREKELSGGGLLRSHGGWSKVQSMRKQGTKVLSDDRILGGDSFVREVLQEAEDQGKELLTAKERSKQINNDIEEACSKAGITVALLRSGGRKGELPAIRRALAEKFVNDYGLSLAETARQLWVTTAAVSHMVR
ncbi:transposase [Prosthecochloris sp. SCSIO W1101]|uniref:transposase n=1 Tax=Prosthecochloris sp. SCSIO W1101 TaxID=2992242 RepID=UPI00223DA441|nr:transposase [Prosthecochloris sp. SCSIO W1101]UZJ40225.1 transposase [Prosthecochloris sp. SCSIO W1101]